jgi:hypothetical protein
MKPLLVAAAAAATLAAAPSALAADAWAPFGDATTGFRVDLPCAPQVQNGVMSAGTLSGPDVLYLCPLGDHGQRGAMLIAVVDLSAQTMDRDALLDAMVETSVKGVDATLDRSDRVDAGGDPARDVAAHDADSTFRARMILHHGRVFELLCVGPTKDYPDAYAHALPTFKVLP